MKNILTLAFLTALAAPAAAEGFDTTDLTRITPPETFFGGKSFDISSEPDRLTLLCTDCSTDMEAVDFQIGRQTDGTEERYRSGVTTLASLEAQCQERAPECTLEAAEVGGAVGWISTFDRPDGAGSTAVLFHDGDMLVIRSLGPNAATALANSRAAVAELAVQVVGQ